MKSTVWFHLHEVVYKIIKEESRMGLPGSGAEEEALGSII